MTDANLWLQPQIKIGVLHLVSSFETDVQFRRVAVNKERVVIQYSAAKPERETTESCPVDLSEFNLLRDQKPQLETLLQKHAKVLPPQMMIWDIMKQSNTTSRPLMTSHHSAILQDTGHQGNTKKDHIKKLLNNQVIQDSQSPYASPVVLVHKKNGDLWLCNNYQNFNLKEIHTVYL